MHSFEKLKSLFLGLVFFVVTSNFICINERETCRAILESLTKFFARRPPAKLLVIGVTSAPDHFQRRQAARSTWMRLLNEEVVDVKFIVGGELCSVPPDDRVTPWDCVGWNLTNGSGGNFNDPLSTFKKTEPSPSTQINGFTFLVKRSISRVKLSVASCALNNGKARLILLDSSTNQKIASASFLEQTREPIQWKSVDLSLKEGFEGELLLKSDSIQTRNCSYGFNTGGVVHFFETSDGGGGSYTSVGRSDAESVPFGFSYQVDDPQNLSDFLTKKSERMKQWALSSERLRIALLEESERYNDILFVETVDVYKHLTQKIVSFMKWLNDVDGYEFALKTDDDVFLDVTRIVAQLEASRAERVTHWWWSCFKVNSTARSVGKWRDRISKDRVYPEFPTGAGYVLSSDLIDEFVTTVTSSPLHHHHLGEDVALGVWAQGRQLATPRRPICYWSCGRRCDIVNHPRCNLVELDTDELMYRTWEMYQDCGHFICDCL